MFSMFLSVILIIIILVTSMSMYTTILSNRNNQNWNFVEYISLRYGLGIYSGWITSAAILNITIFLYKIGFHKN